MSKIKYKVIEASEVGDFNNKLQTHTALGWAIIGNLCVSNTISVSATPDCIKDVGADRGRIEAHIGKCYSMLLFKMEHDNDNIKNNG